MRENQLALFNTSPTSGRKLDLTVYDRDGDHVTEGLLAATDGEWFPIVRGVPSFLGPEMQSDLGPFAARHGLTAPAARAGQAEAREQALTNKTFSDKWARFKNYGFETSHKDFLFEWYRKKFGLASLDELKAFYSRRQCVLEVGPGSGFNTRFIAENCPGAVFALDVSEAAFTTFENTRDLPNCTVVQADLMQAPFADGAFDLIIADGVLHHTPDTRAAVEALYRKLAPGGQFFFYVYRKMGPARVFCDNHIREQFTQLTPEACYEACEGLTDLGRALSQLGVKITLTKAIDVLGIPAGEHDVQRLVYYGFLKCFWNDAFDYETNNMVNFDWYHPHNAWQHTEAEVQEWLEALGAESWTFNASNPNGISVLATKP